MSSLLSVPRVASSRVPEDAGRAEDTRSKLERRTVPRACFNSDLDFRLKMLCHVPKLKEKEEQNEVKI